jgi:predicted CopG family antitoxin|tara:strand:- start:113 stop:268 length:156 start_codon:yes stop_codon:yes gene_type:complete
MATLIQVSDELWKILNDNKTKDCKTFEDVIWRLIKDDTKTTDETNNEKDVE